MRTPPAITTAAVLLLTVACKSAAEREAERRIAWAREEESLRAAMHDGVPDGSPLRRVEFAMSERDVLALLGRQASTGSRADRTKVFAFGFQFGSRSMIYYHWRGMGSVEFLTGPWGARPGAFRCIHDP